MGCLTLMKLITEQLFPQSGAINVPAHVRTLLVHHEPLLFESDLWYNLTFGRQDCDPAHVWDLCRSLGLSEHLIGKGSAPVGTGGGLLRWTDRQVVCIARALLSDAQAIFFAKPGVGFAPSQRRRVLDTIADWAFFRGSFASEGDRRSVRLATGQDLKLDGRTVILNLEHEADIPYQCTAVANFVSVDGNEPMCAVNLKDRTTGTWPTLSLDGVLKSKMKSFKQRQSQSHLNPLVARVLRRSLDAGAPAGEGAAGAPEPLNSARQEKVEGHQESLAAGGEVYKERAPSMRPLRTCQSARAVPTNQSCESLEA